MGWDEMDHGYWEKDILWVLGLGDDGVMSEMGEGDPTRGGWAGRRILDQKKRHTDFSVSASEERKRTPMANCSPAAHALASSTRPLQIRQTNLFNHTREEIRLKRLVVCGFRVPCRYSINPAVRWEEEERHNHQSGPVVSGFFFTFPSLQWWGGVKEKICAIGDREPSFSCSVT